MLRHLALLVFAIAFALTPIAVGCGSDDDTTGPGDSTADFSGNWDFTGQVVARTVCDNEIGTTREWDVVITQVGNVATITFDGGPPTELTVEGSTATGSKTEGELLDFELSIAGDEITGTITARDSQMTCTEVWTVTGTRTSSPPASGFSGSWDLQLTVTATGCDGGAIGETMDLCVTIQIDGNTLFIEDESGRIEGVGNGNSATLSRTNQDESIEVELTLSGSSLTGTVTIFNFGGQCETTASLAGSKRTSPCPPPGDFAGDWDMSITVSSSECPDEQVGDFFLACMSVSVDGSDISIDDGSFEGPITGTIDGNRANLMRTSENGTLTVELTLEGNAVIGTATMVYSSGGCAGASVEYSLAGTRRSFPCGSGSGGPFAGYWDIDGNFTLNECGFTIEPECDEFLQDGNTLYITGSGITASVSGNTATFNQVEEFEGVRFTVEGEITLAGDGNSFTGTQSITLEDLTTQQSCTSSANIVGTRTDPCTPIEANTFGLIVRKGR